MRGLRNKFHKVFDRSVGRGYNSAFVFGQLAQLVEQRIENPRVRGSIPRLATKFQAAHSNVGRFHF